MKPIIRAAIDSGRPPLELLLDQPDRKRSKWDGKLIKALYLHDSYEVDGYPIWVEESPDITFQAKRTVLRSAAVVEKAQESHSNKKNPEKGVRFYAKAVLRDGARWPTRAEWAAKQSNKSLDPLDDLDEKAKQRAFEAEERAAARISENPEALRIIEEMQQRLQERAGRLDE